MSAQIIEVADKLVTDIRAYALTEGYTDLNVQRVYTMTHDLNKSVGKKVDVYPVSVDSTDDSTRTDTFYNFSFSLVVFERYIQAGNIPNSWIDDNVLFVQTCVFNPFDGPTGVLFTVDGIDYWVDSISIPTVFDYDMVREHKSFWSEVELTLRRDSNGL